MSNREEHLRQKTPAGRVPMMLGDIFSYGLTLAASKFSILLMVPIFTRFLSSEAYGMLDTIMLTGTSLIVILIMAQEETVGRFYFDHKNEERKEVLSSGVLIVLLNTFFVLVMFYVLSERLITFIAGGTTYLFEFRLMILYASATAFLSFFRSVCRWTFQKKLFFLLSVLPTLLMFLLTAVFVIFLDMGVRGALYAQIIANSIFAVAGLISLSGLFSYRFPKKLLRSMYNYGLPLMLAAFVGTLLNVVDKSLYIRLSGVETLGLYTLAARYAMFIGLPIAAVITAMRPIIFSVYKEADAVITAKNISHLYSGCFAFIIVAQAIFAKPVILILGGEAYVASAAYFLPLAMGLVLEFYSQLTGIGLELGKKTYYTVFANLIGLFVMVLAAWFLNKRLEVLAVPYGFLIGRIVTHALTTYLARRVYPLRPFITHGYILLIMGFIFAFMSQNIIFATTWRNFAFAFILLLIMGLTVIFSVRALRRMFLERRFLLK